MDIDNKIQIFCSYSHKDEELKDQLERHLSILKRIGLIDVWTDRRILPGEIWSDRITKEIESVDIILLLISSDFLSSDYCFDIEIQKAIAQHEAGNSVVVPILLRECDFEGAPFEHIQGLPTDMKPIISKYWHSPDEGWKNVVVNLKKTINKFSEYKKSSINKEFENLPNSIDAYINFIARYISGDLVDKAKERIKRLDEINVWENALAENSIKKYEEYLIKYPDGKFLPKAKEYLMELQSKKVKSTLFPLEKGTLLKGITSKDLREQITNFLAFLKYKHEKKSQTEYIDNNLHLVFSGDPGTGKTTVARILGILLKDEGILRKGHIVEVTRSNLIAQYVGQTSINVQKIVKEAIGGILFIDEAYNLILGERDSFGREAVDTLIMEMFRHEGDICVILSGYPNELDIFLNSNPGLKRRMPTRINFPNPNSEELLNSFILLLDKEKLLYNKYFIEKVKEILVVCTTKKENNFGNYGFVQNLFQNIMIKFLERCDNLDTDRKEIELIIEDIPSKYQNNK